MINFARKIPLEELILYKKNEFQQIFKNEKLEVVMEFSVQLIPMIEKEMIVFYDFRGKFFDLTPVYPEISLGIKVLHYVMVFVYQISGMKPKAKFSRNLMNTILFIPQPHVSKGVQSVDLNVPHFEEKYKFVKIRIFEDLSIKQENKSVFIFIHGGGFVMGFHRNYDDYCRKLARRGMIVIAIMYRLAPEHPFPAAVHDCFSVAHWLEKQKTVNTCESLQNADFKKICIGGDSAGGNLSVVFCTYVRDQNLDIKISAQIIAYPGFFFEKNLPSIERKDKRYLLTEEVVQFFVDSYAGENEKEKIKDSPLLNPMNNPNGMNDLPPALVFTVDIDPLHDDGVEYVKELKKCNIEVKHVDFKETIHGFLVLPWVNQYKNAFNEIMTFLKDDVKLI
eukprot:gene2027-1534_t